MNTMIADPLVGRTVDGRYRVESRIAVGGMATVYRAVDTRLDRTVAVKVMREQWADDPDFISRFHSEARTAARLSHPHAVGVSDQGEWEGLVFLVMEYVAGRNLRAVLRDSGPLSPSQALAILDQLLQALAAAHEAGFIHRDIKPENLLITDADQVKVTDFGLARALQAPGSATSGMLIGTAAYLSPEQVSGEGSDERSDIYQAGVLLYELLTGQAPFAGETSWAVAHQHVNATVPPVTDLRPDCPQGVADLVADATQRDPQRRPADVATLRARVARLREQLPAPTPLPRRTAVLGPVETPLPEQPTSRESPPPAAAPQQEKRRPKRRRRWLWVGALAMITTALALAMSGGVVANPFDRTDVPDVLGRSEASATARLTEAGFTVEITDRQFSEEIRAGEIVGTDPGPGSSARTGSEVGMVVSLGPERYEVPKVRGQTPAAAATTLAATNLAMAGERRAYHDKVEQGLVIGTDPARGKKLKRDAPVTLLVSRGPAPVDVPNLAGTAQDAAEQQLADVGLKSRVGTQTSETVPKGAVIQTEPAAGTTVYRGDRVRLIVSEGPPPVPVPDVVDMSREEAVRTLEDAGFEAELSESVVTPLNRVFESDPPAGTLAPKGSTVIISIF